MRKIIKEIYEKKKETEWGGEKIKEESEKENKECKGR